MSSHALGRAFNVVPTADGVEVCLSDAGGVTFVCVGANAETFTVAEATDAAGTGAATLATVTTYYTNSGAAGATTWARVNQAAGGVITTTTALPVAVIEIEATELSDGFSYVRCTSSSTGTVVALLRDLAVQRGPANLVAPAL